MNVSVSVRGGSRTWDEGEIRSLTLHALERMGVPQGSEVSVSLVSASEIQRLNEEYRGIDTPTDVLSFECDSAWDEYADDEVVELGDVVMCTDIVDEQRSQFGTTFEQEASLMLVHSILHLLGFDHMEPGERAVMERHEKDILDSYGLVGIR